MSCFDAADSAADQLLMYPVQDLRPHPGVLRHGLVPAVHKISSLADRGEAAFSDPLTITHEGYILDGYARWALANMQLRERVLCLVRKLSEEQALIHLLRAQHRSSHLNDFNRIILALELEDWFGAEARRNQQAGGRNKLPSEMTKARPIDVRAEIARVAGVSTGNVNHTKFLLDKAAPEVLAALKQGKIRIGRARNWLKHAKDGGRHDLRHFFLTREMRATSKTLLSRHPSIKPSARCDREFGRIICELSLDEQQALLQYLLTALPQDAVRQAVSQFGAVYAD